MMDSSSFYMLVIKLVKSLFMVNSSLMAIKLRNATNDKNKIIQNQQFKRPVVLLKQYAPLLICICALYSY